MTSLLLLLSALVCSNTLASDSNLRATPEQPRQHIVRRLYGPENAGVRDEISRLEERMDRYQTGVAPDPDHIVPYEDHPFEEARRRLQEAGNATAVGSGASKSNKFRPIRMVFVTDALDAIRDSTNAAKIDWYKNEILPATSSFWSSALSVVPVSGNLRISSTELSGFSHCGDSEFTKVPNAHKSNGVPNSDLILYVSASSSARFCPARTLAVAVPCNFDQFDRPTAGAINVCLDNIKLRDDGTATPDVYQDYVDVTIHEVGHVLGHSSNSYRFFWDSKTGQPRTKRPFQSRSVTCVDGTDRSLILPGESTMVFAESSEGQRFASIVTPKVRAVARNQFDCQSLEGARLENQPTREESCAGDHWDERLYYPEALSGVIAPTANILSSLTLALMEDSGWYRANYTVSRMSPWGLGSGCDFCNSPCLIKGSSGSTEVPSYGRGFFCNNANEKGCSSELTHKMACTVLDYSYFVPQKLPAAQYQYFPETPSKGGPRQADFCPVFGSSYDNLKAGGQECQNVGNAPTFNFFSEQYGTDSKCIPSTAGEALCYRTACVQSDMSFRIQFKGEWLVCEYDFQRHTVRVGEGLFDTTLICPRLAQACPDLFCPFNCAGRGVCNYGHTVNGTIRPRCECFDESDTSPACSDSLIPNGDFLSDGSGLFNNLEENFFDPLLSVFVDHPDAWTTASWGWAGGLVLLFFVLLLCICSSCWPERKTKRYR